MATPIATKIAGLNAQAAAYNDLAGANYLVALFNDGTECTGNGYARQTLALFNESGAISSDGGEGAVLRASAAVSFTASGGSLVYDQLKLYAANGSTLVRELGVGTETTVASGQASASMTIVLKDPPDRPLAGVPDGMVYMHEDDGTTTDNAPAIEAYLNPEADNEGWREQGVGLRLPGRGIGIQSTIDCGAQEGLSVDCNGQADVRAESQYAVGGIGGGPARIVWTDRDSQAGPMLRYRGYGWVFRGLNLQGNYHATTLGSTPLSSGGANLWADSGHRVDVGLEIQGQQSGIGTGKIVADSLAIHHCVTAVKCLVTPTEDNADQIMIGRFVTRGCDTGILIQNKQSVGLNITNYEAGNVTTALHFQRGGKINVGTFSHQAYCDTGLKIDGALANIGVDQSPHTFQHYYVDGGAPDDCLALEVTSDGNTSWAAVEYDYLSVSADRAAATEAPLFSLRRSTRLNIKSGINFYDGMIEVAGGVSTHFSVIRISGDFESGASPYNVLTGSGKAMLEIGSCCEFYSSGSGQLGTFFPRGQYLYQDGTLTALNGSPSPP